MHDHPPLFRVLRWGVIELVPTAVCVVALMAAAYGAYRFHPGRVDLALGKLTTVDHLIVQHQLERLEEPARADVAVFGDSSCLMGIDPVSLGHDLGATVNGFCMLAYVGPAGYATAIERFLTRADAPATLLVVLHPMQFTRHPSWEGWVPVVDNWRPRAPAAERSVRAALEMARLSWIGRAVLSPLPGTFGLYYGGERQFVRDIDDSRGSAIDPRTGFLGRSSLTLPKEPTSYVRDHTFMATLPRLRDAIGGLPTGVVRLVVSPVPQSSAPLDAASGHVQALRAIAGDLGLAPSAVLDTPATMPDQDFSSVTHLNRYGKARFTRLLAAALRPAAQAPVR